MPELKRSYPIKPAITLLGSKCRQAGATPYTQQRRPARPIQTDQIRPVQTYAIDGYSLNLIFLLWSILISFLSLEHRPLNVSRVQPTI
ncbi:hypothetical protein TNIN_237011 [Trichonephila inaurata madagascariensis]|uniref:Uncharacterized protein n=1 Tax=Trichonephila inaurata madagascariensis TaxID=2747483 RepID=A0A8X6Y583_9ARAC|nr:hypothetical protein TNIN_237011 [Trichonephila inaurata madagascariensis]